MSKGLDRNFLDYGIRRADLDIISELCMKHGLDEDWVKEDILKTLHTQKNSDTEMGDTAVEKLINKALQGLAKR